MKKKELMLLEPVTVWLKLSCPLLVITSRVFIKHLQYAKDSARCPKVISGNSYVTGFCESK